jgi:hypothetical protein
MKSIDFRTGWWDIPSTEETEIPKVPNQEIVDNFFDSQGVAHKEFVPQGKKTVHAEFYKGVMDRFLKRIQRFRPAAFCSRDYSSLLDNAPAYNAASVCQFLTKKLLQPFISAVLSRFISAKLLSLPQVENEVKRTPLCGCYWHLRICNWWIKAGPKKWNFRQLFGNCTTAQKHIYIYANGAYFEFKKVMSSYLSPIFKKNQPWNVWTAVCSAAYYTPSLHGMAYDSYAINLYSILMYWIL